MTGHPPFTPPEFLVSETGPVLGTPGKPNPGGTAELPVETRLRLADDYFEEIYSGDDDPWKFASSWYERRKYDLTLAALPRQRYRRAFEPGCSIGVLSEGLARRCDELVSMELMPRIAECADARLMPYPNAVVQRGAVPEVWPAGRFDLIVLSEISYYLTDEGLERTLELMAESLLPGGEVVGVHYLGATNYPQTGRAVQDRLLGWCGATAVAQYAEDQFSLVVMRR